MSDEYIHRLGRQGYSICHKKYPITNISLHDEEITCPKCLSILNELANTDTKTKMLNRIAVVKKLHKDKIILSEIK